jgi:REP element-mobilizing transposase RayT
MSSLPLPYYICEMKKIDYYPPLYKGYIYHIYNRGNGNEKIFFNTGNYSYFLSQYYNYLSEYLDTFAYCFLQNHFHILARSKVINPEIISEQMRRFFISYSMAINIQEKRKGNLFQRGFKRKVIDDERYLYAVVYYIHSNPVHHKLIKDFTEYPFSSYHILLNDKQTTLCKDEVFEWFNGKINFIKYHSEYRTDYNKDFIIEGD